MGIETGSEMGSERGSEISSYPYKGIEILCYFFPKTIEITSYFSKK